jgi:hypothetical protein
LIEAAWLNHFAAPSILVVKIRRKSLSRAAEYRAARARVRVSPLEAVKQRLKSQREEMLRRHAEELRALESDQAETETLDQLIGAFATKFMNERKSSFQDPLRR